jgi:hypothetical protein
MEAAEDRRAARHRLYLATDRTCFRMLRNDSILVPPGVINNGQVNC